MTVFTRILGLIGFASPPSDESLAAALGEFDQYSHQLMLAVDPQWDTSTRLYTIEYCAFLYGATLAIVRGFRREDADSAAAAILGSYLSRFMDWQFSVGWLLNCQAELSRSPRLQAVQAAGANTAQTVLAATRWQSEILSRPESFQLLIEIFAEVRKLMDDRAASDECLFAASDKLCSSV